MPVLPGDPDKLRKLFAAAREQMEMVFGDQHDVAIVGPANVGKSTLFNRLIGKGERPAEVSPIPGTTRDNRAADAGPFTVIDTPGADAVGPVGERERELALQAAAGADFLVIIFDAIQGVKREEQSLFAELQRLGKPYIVVLNKIDLVGKQEKAVVANAAPISGWSRDHHPGLRVEGEESGTGGQRDCRRRAAAGGGAGSRSAGLPLAAGSQLITRSASESLVALTPLPFVDFIPRWAQVTLILGIARIYNYQLTPARARSGQRAGRRFSGAAPCFTRSPLGGPPTWLVAVAVAKTRGDGLWRDPLV